MATWPSPPAPVSTGDPVPSVGYNKLIQMGIHLKERLDGLTPFTNSDAGALVAGDLLIQDVAGGARKFKKSAASAGAAGPFFVCLGSVAIAGTGYAAHIGFVDLNYTGTAPVAGDQLQASATAGLAMVGSTNPFALAYADGGGGSVQAILYGPGSSGGGGGGGGSGSLLWDPYGLVVPPVATDLSVHDHWSGSGILTVLDQTGDAVVFKNPAAGAIVERGAFGTTGGPLAVPAPPYTATLCLIPNIPQIANWACSLSLRQSSNDKRIAYRLVWVTGLTMDGVNWTDYQTVSGAAFGAITHYEGFPLWVRIRDDAANCYWEYSKDGKWWAVLTSGSTGAFCTPNQAGVTMDSFAGGSGGLGSMTVLSLSVVNTA